MSALISENQQWSDSGGAPIAGGKIYIGDAGADPVLNPKAIFSDRDLTVPLANPVDIDADGFPETKIWLSGRYSLQVDNAAAVTLISELDNGEAEGSQTITLDNVAGINAITADGVPTATSLDDNDVFLFEIVSQNTADAVTLNIDGLGAKAIKRSFDLDVGVGRFKAGQKVLVIYNAGNDNFELVNDNRGIILTNQGADIASASTVDLATATGNNLSVTGSENVTDLGTVIAGASFKLKIPGDASVVLTSSSVADPSQLLCAAAHLGTTGDSVYISGHSGSVPDINGFWPITVIDADEFTIPVDVTTGGTGGTIQLVPKFSYNAVSLILPGEADLIPLPGSTLEFDSLGSGNWYCTNYQSGQNQLQMANGEDAIDFASLSALLLMSPARSLDMISGIMSNQIDIVTATDAAHPIPEWANKALIFAVGGGGGGGAGHFTGPATGGGGGGGGVAIALVDVTAGGTLDIAIGAAGAAAAAGGNTTIDTTLVVANGGGGGGAAAAAINGAGGGGGTTSSTGTLISSSRGDNGKGTPGTLNAVLAGIGGDTAFFGGSGGETSAAAGTGPGAGGAGRTNTGSGGVGVIGKVVIVWLA